MKPRRTWNPKGLLYLVSALQALTLTIVASFVLAAIWPIGIVDHTVAFHDLAIRWVFELIIPFMVIGTITGVRKHMRVQELSFEEPEDEPLWKTTPDQLRHAWTNARSDLFRYLKFGFVGVLLFALFITTLFADGPTASAGNNFIVFLTTSVSTSLSAGLLIMFGTLLSHVTDLVGAAKADREIVRERRSRTETSELGGSLEVTAGVGGDLAITVESGALEEQEEVVLDLATVHEERHVNHEVPS